MRIIKLLLKNMLLLSTSCLSQRLTMLISFIREERM